MQAMILAAGFGTRLLPHTQLRPKPLFPILNTPLLLLTIKRLQRLGFNRIVVNAHHLAGQICDAVAGIDGVTVQVEETILGTGGGLRRAVESFSDEPLLVTNGDIYHDVDLLALYRHHLRSGCNATLGMHDYPRFNQVLVSGDRIRSFAAKREGTVLAFTGLHIVQPEVLRRIAADRFSCIIDLYRQLLLEGTAIGAYRCDGSFWTDMGTVGDYLALHAGLLRGEVPLWSEITLSQQPFCLDSETILEAGAELCDWAVIGNSRLGAGSKVIRSVIWDGLVIDGDAVICDTLISGPNQTGDKS